MKNLRIALAVLAAAALLALVVGGCRPAPDPVIPLGTSHMSGPLDLTGSASASAPGLVFEGDTDTGLYNSAANTLGFAAGGTEVATLDSNGLKSKAGLDAQGGDITLQNDEKISNDTDAQVELNIDGADILVFNDFGASTINTDTTEYLVEIADGTNVMTAGTNSLAALNIDLGIGNSTGGTNSVYGILIDSIVQDASNTETGIYVNSGWDTAASFQGGVDVNGALDVQGGDITLQNDETITNSTDGDVQISGALIHNTKVISKSANYSLLASESGAIVSQCGASGILTFTLPEAAAGMSYHFYVCASQAFTITPDSGDQILHFTNAVGDRINTTGTAGDSVKLVALDDQFWVPLSETGTWNDGD